MESETVKLMKQTSRMADSRAGGGGNGEMLPKGIDLQLVDKKVGDLRHSAGTPPVYRNHRTC